MTDETPEISKDRINDILFELVSSIPSSSEQPSDRPKDRCQAIKRNAAIKAAAISTGCSIPSGPAGWITIFHEILYIWEILKQMVADIAHVYGKQSMLGPEQMIYCLFKHTGVRVVNQLLVKVGNKVLLKRCSIRTIQKILFVIGVRITQRILRRVVPTLISFVGAAMVVGFAYRDTCKVADTAIELFEQDPHWDRPNGNVDGPEPTFG